MSDATALNDNAMTKTKLGRLIYSFRWLLKPLAWCGYFAVVLLMFLGAWPLWVWTGHNILKSHGAPFQWMRNLDNGTMFSE